MAKEKYIAVVLAAGRGSRMGSGVHKQYRELCGKPVLAYSLLAMEESLVDEVILVTGEGEEERVREEIVSRYGLSKVKKIVPGGKERYHSVYAGLCAAGEAGEETYVLIHDAARAFLRPEEIAACAAAVRREKACVLGVPVKDTIKQVDAENYAVKTPDRRMLWQVQTPQCFVLAEIREAYRRMLAEEPPGVTDDAMVMEAYGNRRVRMVMGSYENIKITTPEDMVLGEAILAHRNRKGIRE